jgi:hypothetical protein
MPLPDRAVHPITEIGGRRVTLRSLFDAVFRLVYRPGHNVRKALSLASCPKRLDSLSDASDVDLILIYREIFPIGPAVVERLLAIRRRPPIVFDYDDAIFLESVSDANRFIRALKMPGKVATIIRHTAHVIAGNEYWLRTRDASARRDRHSDVCRHHQVRALAAGILQ